MACAEAERIKIEWFHGITLFLESEYGKVFLNGVLGEGSTRDEIDHKIFLMLIEAALPNNDLQWETEQHLSNWQSSQRSGARKLFLDGRFARGDLWDQRAWEKRFNELQERAIDASVIIQKLIEDKKAELEDEIASQRQTPIVPVSYDMIALTKPSDMITLQCENDPEAMERVRRYLEEMGSDLVLSSIVERADKTVRCDTPKTIYPPPSVPPGNPDGEVVIPSNIVPSIIPKQDDGPEISAVPTDIDPEELLKD